MRKFQGLLFLVAVFGISFMLLGGKAEAVDFAGETHSPSAPRQVCVGDPVDFSSWITNVNLDTTTGVVTYNVNIEWIRCTLTETRAYAIYSNPSICPLSGLYGGSMFAYDCVKYVGNPAYTGPGNGLNCLVPPGGTNGQCVSSGFGNVLRTEQQPSIGGDGPIVIPMSYTIPNWWAELWNNSSGSANISGDMCQFFKTGAGFNTLNSNSRCQRLNIDVSWDADDFETTGQLDGDATSRCNVLSGWIRDDDTPIGNSMRIDVHLDAPAGTSTRSFNIFSAAKTANAQQQAFSSAQIANYRDSRPHTLYIYYIGTGPNASTPAPQVITIGPCAPPTCNLAVSEVLVSSPFTVDVDIADNRSGQGVAMGAYTATASGSGINPPLSQAGTVNAATNSATNSWTGTGAASVGTFIVSATITYTGGSITCNQTVRIVDKPYLKFFGGEVMTGGGFNYDALGCTPESISPDLDFGSINTWAQPAGGGYKGSSAQLTVSALMDIGQFYSGSQQLYYPVQPKGLTFANTDSSTYGGDSENQKCITNFFEDTKYPVGSPDIVSPFASALGGGTKQYHHPAGDLTIGGNTITLNTQVAVYVDGDVFINDDIDYATGATTIAQMPSFYVIAKGNIYIGSNVTTLDGVYIAQASAPGDADTNTTGYIYTCATAIRVPVALGDLRRNGVDGCNTQLTVNGGLIAQDIKFMRTQKSIGLATPGEVPNFGTGVGTNAAEVINYTPEVYLAPSPLFDKNRANTTNPSAVGKYQSIKSLPPVF